MNKLTALIEAAKAATPGPWQQQSDGWTVRIVQCDTELERGWRIATTHQSGPDRVEQEVANAEFIALANPATILELCALLEKAEEALLSEDAQTMEGLRCAISIEALAAIKQWKEQT